VHNHCLYVQLADVVPEQANHVLGTCPLHRRAYQVHDELLLDQKHLLPAVGRPGTDVGHGKETDGTVLSVDTFHTSRSGRKQHSTVHYLTYCFPLFLIQL